MEDFTAGNISNQSSRRQSTLGAEWDQRVRELVTAFGAERAPELIEEMIVTALKMARDKMGVADLKLISRSMKELRYAARVFSAYRAFRKVAVFGSARVAMDSPEAKVAEDFARQMVAQQFMIITGGGDGIMGAAQRGAGRDMSFGLNIRLPFEQRANETIDGDKKLINFNYFFTRKLNFVKETHAFAMFPGGFGTLDESFEVLTLMQTGKARIIPVVLLDKPEGGYWETWLQFVREHLFKFGFVSPDDFCFFKITHNVEEAVREITGFYRVYHSARWVGEQLVLRLVRPLSKEKLADLNTSFADLLRRGQIVQSKALPPEKNEPEIWELPRLIFSPHRRNFGRFRQLIDSINCSDK
ncbi:MAG: TIGR00730 family Rossman fold protein [Chthoniobacterales bacterium]